MGGVLLSFLFGFVCSLVFIIPLKISQSVSGVIKMSLEG